MRAFGGSIACESQLGEYTRFTLHFPPITEAEENVARLVQQGLRNRDIAGALHYSPRTIEVYLSRSYAKRHVSARLELARVLDAMQQR